MDVQGLQWAQIHTSGVLRSEKKDSENVNGFFS